MKRTGFSPVIDKAIKGLLLPLIGLAVFTALWQFASGRIDTSLGSFPGPGIVWSQAIGLVEEFKDEKQREREFYERQ